MATLRVVNGQGTVILQMANDDLRRLMKDVAPHLRAGEGFWARSAADRSSGPKALWVPPGSIVQFELDHGREWDDPMLGGRRAQTSIEEDDTALQRAIKDDDDTGLRRAIEEDDTALQRAIEDDDDDTGLRRAIEEDDTALQRAIKDDDDTGLRRAIEEDDTALQRAIEDDDDDTGLRRAIEEDDTVLWRDLDRLAEVVAEKRAAAESAQG